MRIFLIFSILLLFSCQKENVVKPYSEWENYFNENDANTHLYISSLGIINPDIIIMSAFKRIDFSYNYTNIFTFSNNEIIEVDSLDFLELDPSLKKQKGIKDVHFWYNENLIIKYDENPEQIMYSWLVAVNNPLKSSQCKTDSFGNLWEATNDGINEFNGQNWRTHFKGKNFWAICFDEQKNLYASTLPNFDEPGIILKYDYEKWDTILICSSNAKWVPCLHFDKTNNLWFGVLSRNSVAPESGDGLFKYDGNSLINLNINNSKLPSNSVIEITIDTQENKWLGMYSGGLAKLNSKNEIKIYNKNNTLMPFESIEHIVIDRTNNIWMAVQYFGLAKLKE